MPYPENLSLWSLFFLGLILGGGVCGIHCGILLTPIVARGSRNLSEGMGIGLRFSIGKIIVYAFFGGMAAWSGRIAMNLLGARVLALTGGLLLIVIGVWFMACGRKCARNCRTGSPFMLGLIDGIFPCGPTVGLVIYIANSGQSLSYSILAGVLFGLGTLAVPVLTVCGMTPYIWKKFSRLANADLVLRIVGGIIFLLWGLNLLLA